MKPLLLVVLALVGIIAQLASGAEHVFDFEDASPGMPTQSSAGAGSVLSRTLTRDRRYKHGEKSMIWQWSAGTGGRKETLRWDLNSFNIIGQAVRGGGIKLHVYSTIERAGKCLRMCIRQEETKKPATCVHDPNPPYWSCFYMSLDFKGWRAIWVTYKEFRGCPNTNTIPANSCFDQASSKVTSFFIQAPEPVAASQPIYIDYLRFADDMEDETRDKIVPPIIKFRDTVCYTCSQFSSIRETDATNRHPQNKFWDQAYRWDKKQNAIEASTPVSSLPSPTTTQRTEMLTIKKRLLSWYAQEGSSYFNLKWSSTTRGRVHKRWESFLNAKSTANCMSETGSIECAHKIFHDLDIHPSTLTGPGLYCRNCKHTITNNEKYFRDIFHKVLLPMAVEYRIWSKVEERACVLTKRYHCSLVDKTGFRPSSDLDALIGKDTHGGTNSLDAVFTRAFGTSLITPGPAVSTSCRPELVDCVKRFTDAITAVQGRRKEKIRLLFKYIRDQGFREGSSLGSLGHQMLQGSGYMHAAFLVADTIPDTHLTLQNILDTMKWFTEFGEVYNDSPYEYKGTTADKFRTIMPFRLLAIMAMPDEKAKLRDLTKLKNWIDNSLEVNEGTLGLLKPDFTAFHHSFYYGGAYTPEALHAASWISYMLDGNPTSTFKLSTTAKRNIEEGLMVLREVAVKYSTPSSVGGRYPDYYRLKLGKEMMAFAYISLTPPGLDASDNLMPITALNPHNGQFNAKMFKRLYIPHVTTSPATLCPSSTNFCSGKIGSITFMNTLGTAEILEKAATLISPTSVTAEASPTGNWAKSYAALSIHRRGDWAVTVKGFSHLVYDPERYRHKGENEYGLYGAHGAILIANSEDALTTKDVNGGWDWRRIPGTTTIDITDAEIKEVKGSRYSNRKKLAGGLSFKGTSTLANGVFGMDFSMPRYKFYSTPHPFYRKIFRFRKSVFFFDDILVCLGSGITSTVNKNILSSIFQDKVVSTTATPSTTKFYCNEGTRLTKDNFAGDVRLIDPHGNKYFIPSTVSADLVLHRKVNQTFMKNKESHGKTLGWGIYCTAWFDHGITPTTAKKYRYFVKVNAVPTPHDHTRDPGTFDVSAYMILQDSTLVHTVKKTSTAGEYICGYSVFHNSAVLDSRCPLLRTDTESLMMVEKTSTHLYISVSYPPMDLQKTPAPPGVSTVSPNFCANAIPTSPAGSNDGGSSLLFCAADSGVEIKVTLRSAFLPLNPLVSVSVGGESKASGDFNLYAVREIDGIRFKALKHGKTTEIKLPL